MTWQYQDTPVETLPEECVGFVYLITNNLSGRKYIGKKLAKFSMWNLGNHIFLKAQTNYFSVC